MKRREFLKTLVAAAGAAFTGVGLEGMVETDELTQAPLRRDIYADWVSPIMADCAQDIQDIEDAEWLAYITTETKELKIYLSSANRWVKGEQTHGKTSYHRVHSGTNEATGEEELYAYTEDGVAYRINPDVTIRELEGWVHETYRRADFAFSAPSNPSG